MAKLHAYTSQKGVYLRTNIENQPQTLQVKSQAADLLAELGYQPGDTVPRDVTKPLVIVGFLHTKPGGRTISDLLDGYPQLSPTRCPLSPTQQNRLQQFLERFAPAYSRTQHDRLTDFLTKESPLDPIEWQEGEVAATDRVAHLQDIAATFYDDEETQPGRQSASEQHRTTSGSGKTETHHSTSTSDPVSTASIPRMLRQTEQWVCWRTETRDDDETKVPINPHTAGFASVTDSETWASFEVAVDALDQDRIDGIGFVFTENDTLAGVDLDTVRDRATGDLTETARDIVTRLDSYTEVSPSGTGVHVILHGFTPDGRTRHDGIELYDRARFFTVTGDHLDGTPDVVHVRHDELQTVHQEYVAREPDESTEHSKTPTGGPQPLSDIDADIDPDVVLERAKQSETFERLWHGDTSGYPSHSEADMALCCSLAYRTGDDIELMDQLFRRSGLMREKWDAQRGSQTYGELTLQNAVQFVDEYDPYLEQIGADSELQPRVIAELQPEEAATIEATVQQVQTHPSAEIFQDGYLTDETAQVRFVTWEETTDRESVRVDDGSRYRFRNVWVTSYDESLEVHLNEHTTVESL